MHAYDDVDGVPCVASRELFYDHPARAVGLRRDRGLRLRASTSWSTGITSPPTTSPSRHAMALDAGWTSSSPTRPRSHPLVARSPTDGWPDAHRPGGGAASCGQVPARPVRGAFVDELAAAVSGDGGVNRALALEVARRSIVLLENEAARCRCGRTSPRLAVSAPTPTVPVRSSVTTATRCTSRRSSRTAWPRRRGRRGAVTWTSSSPTSWHRGRPCLRPSERGPRSGGGPLRTGMRHPRRRRRSPRRGGRRPRRGGPTSGVLGERLGLTAESTSGETRDRMDLGLLGSRGARARRSQATGTPVILVLISGARWPCREPCRERPAVVQHGCPARSGRGPSPMSSSATSTRAASCR